MKIIVTGGAGFIGSHLVDELVKSHEVTVIDNLSSGSKDFFSHHLGNKRFSFIKADLVDSRACAGVFKKASPEAVYHLAANPDVRGGEKGSASFQRNNVVATLNVLDACRDGNIKKLVFASTSTVYGNALARPTPESYGPLLPISHYGASKLACEAYLSSYADNYGLACAAMRFANVIGGRQNHGVIFDFIRKLKASPRELEILGDGKNSKSYVHVTDCVSGLLCVKTLKGSVEVYNLGSKGQTTVNEIADEVIFQMGLSAKKIYTGKTWAGDVKLMSLDYSKLSKTGWKPKLDSNAAVKRAVGEVLAHG
ncbi:hypothetical protein AUJ14_02245 [Candidatus Micrarchaeota archaeon CG1_02_55_22]|nr:MAG: hypothetical protein AUJ14_02245 [Candidatus Micrarchaeota archaeon CG1_02_55_22]